MNFMKKDEFLLLLAHCEGRAFGFEKQCILNIEERKRLYAVGIRTAHEQPAWSLVQPHADYYDWDYLDGIINRNREAGLKSLIQICGWMLPPWMPKNWMAREANGAYYTECLSLWNEEAQEYSDDYYRLICEHYKDQPDVSFFYGEFQGGEGIYQANWCIYDDAALIDYRKVYGTSARPVPDSPETLEWYGNKIVEHLLRKAKILYEYTGEIWNAQQYLMDTWSKAFGNFRILETMKRFRDEFPNANIVFLQYTYFDPAHHTDNEQFVDIIRDISQCEVIAEAMFCSGLPTTTPLAIAKGFRGQIVQPAQNQTGEPFEQWMVDNIRDSHNLWMDKLE